MRYRITQETIADVEVFALRDAELDSEVRVVPALGNTCVGFRLGDWKILDEPPNETELRTAATSYGIPILFPWPNRLRNGQFTFKGREYQVPLTPGMPNAIHGLVRDRPWRVARTEVSEKGALLESAILSRDFPELADQYPSAFELKVAYLLGPSALSVEALVVNVGAGPLPFGFGLHPYFTVPLGPAGRRASCELGVPGTEAWELVDYLPTGIRRPVAQRTDLRSYRALGDETYDDVLTGLPVGLAQFNFAAVRDPLAGRAIVLRAEGGYRECVVYAPDHRQVVALEPYTCTTDALNLEARGVDAGLRVLNPGESWRALVEINPRRI